MSDSQAKSHPYPTQNVLLDPSDQVDYTATSGQPVLTPEKSNKPQRISCDGCRIKKVKCPGDRPQCSNCTRKDRICTYPAVVRRRGPDKHPGGRLKNKTEAKHDSKEKYIDRQIGASPDQFSGRFSQLATENSEPAQNVQSSDYHSASSEETVHSFAVVTTAHQPMNNVQEAAITRPIPQMLSMPVSEPALNAASVVAGYSQGQSIPCQHMAFQDFSETHDQMAYPVTHGISRANAHSRYFYMQPVYHNFTALTSQSGSYSQPQGQLNMAEDAQPSAIHEHRVLVGNPPELDQAMLQLGFQTPNLASYQAISSLDESSLAPYSPVNSIPAEGRINFDLFSARHQHSGSNHFSHSNDYATSSTANFPVVTNSMAVYTDRPQVYGFNPQIEAGIGLGSVAPIGDVETNPHMSDMTSASENWDHNVSLLNGIPMPSIDALATTGPSNSALLKQTNQIGPTREALNTQEPIWNYITVPNQVEATCGENDSTLTGWFDSSHFPSPKPLPVHIIDNNFFGKSQPQQLGEDEIHTQRGRKRKASSTELIGVKSRKRKSPKTIQTARDGSKVWNLAQYAIDKRATTQKVFKACNSLINQSEAMGKGLYDTLLINPSVLIHGLGSTQKTLYMLQYQGEAVGVNKAGFCHCLEKVGEILAGCSLQRVLIGDAGPAGDILEMFSHLHHDCIDVAFALFIDSAYTTVHRLMDPSLCVLFSSSAILKTTPTATCCTAILVLWVVYHILLRRYASITITGSARREEVGKDGESTEELVRRWCCSLKQGFRGSWWLPNGHAQTIYASLADCSKDDHITYHRQLLRLPDGGTIGIDIYPPLAIQLADEAPVIVINHGLTGGSHESYVRNLVVWLTKSVADGGLGGRAAVVNFRGCANTPITSPHLYSSGNTVDNHTATTYLASLFPRAPMLGVGFSLGAAVMTRYLGEQGVHSRLRAAVVLCCPLELRGMNTNLDSAHIFPRFYSLMMARKILKSIYPHLLPQSPLSSPSSPLHVNLPEILSLTTSSRYKWTLRISKVTDMVATKVGGSAPCFPFEGMDQYMEWACPSGWVGRIKRPTLAISALDDPIVPRDSLPYAAIRNSSHMVLAEVPQGGHLGWFDGPFLGPDKHRRWHVRPIVEFLRGAIQELPISSSEKALKDIVVRKKKDGWCWVDEVGWRIVREEEECDWAPIEMSSVKYEP
ncbi:hypothetical protein L204_103816 [Cryptococcus depauperatus]